MKKSKLRKARIKNKSKRIIRKQRAKAARKKKKIERHRRRRPQKETSKGFFITIIQYLLKKLCLRELLEEKLYFKRKANCKYSMVDMFLSLVLLIILKIDRIYHAKEYQQETLLANQLGLQKLPSDTTIYRFLKKQGTLTMCRKLHKCNQALIESRLEQGKEIIVDGD